MRTRYAAFSRVYAAVCVVAARATVASACIRAAIGQRRLQTIFSRRRQRNAPINRQHDAIDRRHTRRRRWRRQATSRHRRRRRQRRTRVDTPIRRLAATTMAAESFKRSCHHLHSQRHQFPSMKFKKMIKKHDEHVNNLFSTHNRAKRKRSFFDFLF